MIHNFLDKVKAQLKNGIQEKGHPFRLGVLATIDPKNQPDLRNIVLRAVTDDLKLTFFTDARSSKVKHIIKNNAVSVLFYNPIDALQIKISGKASIVSDSQLLESTWNAIPDYAQKDYTTTTAPGSTVNKPDEVTYLNKDHFFCMVDIQADSIEYLKLNKTQHSKLKFEKKGENWQGEFLVP